MAKALAIGLGLSENDRKHASPDRKQRGSLALLDKAELLAETVDVGLVQLLCESGIVLQEELQRLQIDSLVS